MKTTTPVAPARQTESTTQSRPAPDEPTCQALRASVLSDCPDPDCSGQLCPCRLVKTRHTRPSSSRPAKPCPPSTRRRDLSRHAVTTAHHRTTRPSSSRQPISPPVMAPRLPVSAHPPTRPAISPRRAIPGPDQTNLSRRHAEPSPDWSRRLTEPRRPVAFRATPTLRAASSRFQPARADKPRQVVSFRATPTRRSQSSRRHAGRHADTEETPDCTDPCGECSAAVGTGEMYPIRLVAGRAGTSEA